MGEPPVEQLSRLPICLVETVSMRLQQAPLGLGPILGTDKDFADLL